MAAGKGGVERSGVSVIVPTTAGAIQVLGLRWSQRVTQSRVVLGNETSSPCERWTKDYHSLLTPGDPMRTLLGLPEGGGCRLVVSSEIDLGRSWIVPVSAAHFADARAQAVHADVSRARMLIWGTGALDFSQPETADAAKVVPHDYHLTSKIDLSREHFAAAAHDKTPVLALLPAGADAERAAGILRKILAQQPHHIEIVASLADVIRPIDAFLRKGDFTAPPDMKYAPVPYTPPPEAVEDEPVAAKAAAAGPAATAPKTEAPPPPPPRHPANAPPPPRPGPQGLAGDPVPTSVAARTGGGLSVGVLGGIAVALIAVIGVGAMMLRAPPGPEPAPLPAVVQPPPQPVRPQQVVIAPAPTAPTPAGAPQPAPVVVTAPPVTPPAVTNPPPIVPLVSGQPTAAAPTPAQPPQATDAALPVGRLTILTPPAGSSCQAQVLAMNPRFVETVIDLSGAQPLLEIDTPAICGLAISGSGTTQSRFAPGTVTGTVASLSSSARIVFNPGNASGRLPDIAVTGGSIEKIELRRK